MSELVEPVGGFSPVSTSSSPITFQCGDTESLNLSGNQVNDDFSESGDLAVGNTQSHWSNKPLPEFRISHKSLDSSASDTDLKNSKKQHLGSVSDLDVKSVKSSRSLEMLAPSSTTRVPLHITSSPNLLTESTTQYVSKATTGSQRRLSEVVNNSSAVQDVPPICHSQSTVSTNSVISTVSGSSRSAKKFSFIYYSLAPSYKTKLDQFRRIFLGTPVDTDRLLVDYSCALSKNNHGLLLQGRMYVTENWVCFYSKILQEQKIYLAVKEIVGITKEKTARVIPNAIKLIYSKNRQRFFFTSFASRERTYAILNKVWDNCRNHQSFLQNNQSMSIEEIVQHLRDIYGDDSLAMLEDEDSEGGAPVNRRSLGNSDSADDQGASGDPVNIQPSVANQWPATELPVIGNSTATTDDDESMQSRGTDAGSRHSITIPDVVQHQPLLQRRCNTPESLLASEPDLDPSGNRSSNQLLVNDDRKRRSRKRHKRTAHHDSLENGTRSSPTLSPKSPTSLVGFPEQASDHCATCFPGHDHPGQMYVNTLIPLSVDALFACIFTDSEFFDRLSLFRGTFNMVQSAWPLIPWSMDPYNSTDPAVTVERVISYTLSLKQKLGPRTCSAIERQTLLVSESRPKQCYVVDAKVNNQAVPLCNCFCVVNRYCLLRAGRLNSRLCVYSRVVYEKPVFFGAKSIIENTCRSGLTDFFTALTAHLTELASGLSEEDRLSGGHLAAPSTNAAIKHNNQASVRNGSKDRDARSKRISHHDHTVHTASSSATSPTRSLPRSPTSPAKGITPGSPDASSVTANPECVPPAHSEFGLMGQLLAFKEMTDFFLRPDRAWFVLCIISLLLCLCLSLVYTRLLALEQLAEQLSSSTIPSSMLHTHHSPRPSDIFGPRSLPFSEDSHAKLRVMKEMTASMSQTLAQMQQVLAKVQTSLELLHKMYTTSEDIHSSVIGVPHSTPPFHATREAPPA